MSWNSVHFYWYALPLILAISVVYAATRHENWREIGAHSVKLAGGILAVMLVATVVLFLANSQVDG
jgi:hypothetical protein